MGDSGVCLRLGHMLKLISHDLENVSVGATVAYCGTWLFWLCILAGLPNQGTQLLCVGVSMGGQPGAKGVVVEQQAVTPEFGLVQSQVVLS
jgi:hypothetical protein